MPRTAFASPALATARPALPARRGVLGRLLALTALRRSRRALSGLDDARLRDLGLTREQALLESRRPFWNAPEHWLR